TFNHAHPSDPMFDEQWSLDNHGTRGGLEGADISAVKAWEKTQGSQKVVVAVLDTGVDYTHVDLVHNIWTRPAGMAPYHDNELGDFDDAHGFDASDMDGDPMDDNGHGTHCAGIVAAAGNSSSDNDRRPHYPSNYNLLNVISVAALNRKDELASFSNWGVKSVHIAAPGAEILSTWPNNQYEEHSGTSMATPEISGVAALVLSLNPDMPVKDLRERLLTSVDKLPALEGRIASGGRINAARAVKAE